MLSPPTTSAENLQYAKVPCFGVAGPGPQVMEYEIKTMKNFLELARIMLVVSISENGTSFLNVTQL